MTKSKYVINKITIIGFLLYFFILLIERIIALILSVNNGGYISLLSGSFFGVSTDIITAGSVLFGVLLFIKPLIKLVKCLFSREIYCFKEDKNLINSVIVLLCGGMMHTGFTIAPIQFVAYGFLILSMIMQVIDRKEDKENLFINICSLIYITLFSMCIPVCYPTYLGTPINVFFYIAEYLAVTLLLPLFRLLLLGFFKEGHVRFSLIPFFVMIISCGLVIGLKFEEEINYFVLIFAILTTLFYLIFGLRIRQKLIHQEDKNEVR